MSTQCNLCKGSGVIRRKQPFSCDYCSNNYCYKCENVPFKGNFEECSQCYGTGRLTTRMTDISGHIHLIGSKKK